MITVNLSGQRIQSRVLVIMMIVSGPQEIDITKQLKIKDGGRHEMKHLALLIFCKLVQQTQILFIIHVSFLSETATSITNKPNPFSVTTQSVFLCAEKELL